MDGEILVDMTISELELIIKLLRIFKGSEKYQKYKEEEKADFEKLIKKLKES